MANRVGQTSRVNLLVKMAELIANPASATGAGTMPTDKLPLTGSLAYTSRNAFAVGGGVGVAWQVRRLRHDRRPAGGQRRSEDISIFNAIESRPR